jgi:hypothetical protein
MSVQFMDLKTHIPRDVIGSNYDTFFLTPSSPKAPPVMLVFMHVSGIQAQDSVVHNDSIPHGWGKKNKKTKRQIEQAKNKLVHK